jgi:hypothetical protein
LLFLQEKIRTEREKRAISFKVVFMLLFFNC